MKTQLLVISAFALTSFAGLGLAEGEGPLHGMAPAVQAVQAAPPKAAADTGKAVDKAGAAKEAAPGAPAAVEEQAQDAARQTLKEAAPPAAKQALKTSANDADKVQQAPKEVGKAAKPAKHQADKSAAPVK
jgi:hypothetical protein